MKGGISPFSSIALGEDGNHSLDRAKHRSMDNHWPLSLFTVNTPAITRLKQITQKHSTHTAGQNPETMRHHSNHPPTHLSRALQDSTEGHALLDLIACLCTSLSLSQVYLWDIAYSMQERCGLIESRVP